MAAWSGSNLLLVDGTSHPCGPVLVLTVQPTTIQRRQTRKVDTAAYNMIDSNGSQAWKKKLARLSRLSRLTADELHYY